MHSKCYESEDDGSIQGRKSVTTQQPGEITYKKLRRKKNSIQTKKQIIKKKETKGDDET